MTHVNMDAQDGAKCERAYIHHAISPPTMICGGPASWHQGVPEVLAMQMKRQRLFLGGGHHRQRHGAYHPLMPARSSSVCSVLKSWQVHYLHAALSLHEDCCR
jgi:hypothetical protein